MPFEGYLYLLAELAAAFVGFTAIGLMVSERRGQVWDFAISGLIERGLAAGFFAVLPGLVFSFGVEAEPVWRICSMGVGAYMLTVGIRTRRQWRSWSAETRPMSPPVYHARAVASLLVMAGAFANVFLAMPGVYLAAVVWVLVMAGWTLLLLLRDLRGR